MWKVTWRNLVARKVRLALSGFAIVLGVAFVAGSFIFTDALSGVFSGIVKGTTPDVKVQPTGSTADFESAAPDARTIDASVLSGLSGLPEVAAADGSNDVQNVFVIGDDGKLVGGNGAPGFALNYTDTEAITGEQILTLRQGDLPDGPGEVALDERTAEKGGYEIGDRVTLVTPGDPPTMQANLTGLVEFGGDGGLAGATLTVLDREVLLDTFFAGRDVYTEVALTAADGVSQSELAQAANAVLPKGLDAREGDALAEENEDVIGEQLSFINRFLLVFAGVALVVGSFLIVNTFSILVAQRSRELALLRAMGASKKQVTRSVVVESLVVGLVGSTVGIGVGYLLSLGLKALFGAIGLDLSGATFAVEPRTILTSYAVGMVVTVFAAYLPARRASRVAPVAAMREEAAMPEATLRRRLLTGLGLVGLGSATMVLGFVGEGGMGLSLIGAGMLAILIGVSLISPVIGQPVVTGLGSLFKRVFGTVGALATENSLRNPRRTAATASALMIGLTLVAMMSILGQSANASTDKVIEESLTAELVVSNSIGQGFSPAIADQIEPIEGVDTVARLRYGNAKIDGDTQFLAATDPAAFGAAIDVPMSQGTFGRLSNETILISDDVASNNQVGVGDTLDVRFPAGEQSLTVGGVFEASAAVPTEYIVTLDTLANGGLQELDNLLYLTTEPGADVAAIEDRVNAITQDLPTVTLKDQQEFADEQKSLINQLLYVIYALLGLAIIIAILGIINTLALSVIERTREVGLLRAVGVSRRQLRRMVRLEAVVIAVLGAVLGVVMGITFGVVLQRAIADQGIEVLAIPWVLLTLVVLAAAVVGVLAAVLPARRAARLNVLTAITTE